ncbi:quinol dehydrogenase ferredoxin subunit NapH [Psychromonas sp. psych-6C06]|uniref:quinol dehydrogenase ferredoxin subunit NapH n=1 Tax=Psychromonas sp. psych-6C06 TaxID=2058089 RepID=UPI000C33C2F2|nr:quinol dehydrogenase ferredoxin subunit NapH [Psychromonas sp. psych-6C06]PKF60678.1 quinol dehydrogenase ferredoxin subunit NapH [Psychromonas sp. psych-6C06]
MTATHQLGEEAIAKKGWLLANRFLLLRRFVQISILSCFLTGPLVGIWILKGNLSSSILFDAIPFSDPFVLLQSVFSGHLPLFQALLGAVIVLFFYFVVGGRVFCSWVCPVNLVTDAAAWCRRKLKLRKEKVLSNQWRFWILAMVMILPLFTGVMTWELVNPVSALHRGLFFGMGLGWLLFLMIFLFDLLAVENGWCGHLCPMGAFYAIINKVSFIKVDAINRDKCTDCLDCFNVCPESQILKGPVHGEKKGISTLVNDMRCTNCGRCIDVCAEDVFIITTVFSGKNSLAKVER